MAMAFAVVGEAVEKEAPAKEVVVQAAIACGGEPLVAEAEHLGDLVNVSDALSHAPHDDDCLGRFG